MQITKKKGKKQGSDQNPSVKTIAMRTLEILIIGAPSCGKTTLAQSLLSIPFEEQTNKNTLGLGMTQHKATINLPSGEPIRLCLWDAKTSMLPKEQVELQKLIDNQGILNTIFGGDKLSDFQPKTDQLLLDYLRTGTYHAVLFVFDPSLILTQDKKQCSFQEMERWFDLYKTLCVKSADDASICFVANNFTDTIEHVKNLMEEDHRNALTEGKLKEQENLQEEVVYQVIPEKIMLEWIERVKQEVQEVKQKKQIQEQEQQQAQIRVKRERFPQEFRYLEVNAKSGRGIAVVKKWMIQQALKRYKHIESKRYQSIEYIAAPKFENTDGKDRKMCGELNIGQKCTIQ